MVPQLSASGQVNNATVTPATPTPTPPTQPSNAEESNQIRAARFLQMVNGNFVVKNTTFTLSSTVSDRMSVQSYAQRSASIGNLWVDSGTNVSTMGRPFRMIEETGHFANMTGFANDL
eukprot:14294696-Ditylum_brightwellii.AAC.1